MGDVAIAIKIMPDGPDTDLNKIKKAVEKMVHEKGMKLKSIQETPIAFGIISIDILIITPDSKGTGNIEEELSRIDGVESVEMGDVTLL